VTLLNVVFRPDYFFFRPGEFIGSRILGLTIEDFRGKARLSERVNVSLFNQPVITIVNNYIIAQSLYCLFLNIALNCCTAAFIFRV